MALVGHERVYSAYRVPHVSRKDYENYDNFNNNFIIKNYKGYENIFIQLLGSISKLF